VEIIEEHDKVGYPKHCTGIISPETRNWLGRPAIECEINSFNEVEVYGSTQQHYTIKGKPIALIVDRVCLENKLLEETLSSGARIYWKTKIIKITEHGEVIDQEKHKKTYDKIIVATGNKSDISLPKKIKRAKTIPGINIVVETNTNLKKHTLIVGFDHKIAPGFFYWIAPLNDNKAVIGAGSFKKITISELAEAILKKHEIALENTRIIETYGGLINKGPLPKRIRIGKLLFIGDSAGITKPITGGGLYPIAYVIGNTTETECYSLLHQVEGLVKKISKKLQKHYPIAKILHEPENQKLIDSIIEYFDKSGLAEHLSYKISFDNHQELVTSVIRNPKHLFNLLRIGIKEKRTLQLLRMGFETLFL